MIASLGDSEVILLNRAREGPLLPDWASVRRDRRRSYSPPQSVGFGKEGVILLLLILLLMLEGLEENSELADCS